MGSANSMTVSHDAGLEWTYSCIARVPAVPLTARSKGVNGTLRVATIYKPRKDCVLFILYLYYV